MKNSIAYLLLAVLLVGKVFAWWMIFWGSNILDAELTLAGMFEPIHQFSYLILSSVLLVGILFRSKFSLAALLVTAPTNAIIFLLHGTSVYQSIWDPVLLALFVAAIVFIKPNRWTQTFGANKVMLAASP